MKKYLCAVLVMASTNLFAMELTLECSGKPIGEIVPAVVGLKLEDRIDRTCARVGEFESTSDLDKGQRLQEFSRLTRRLYPKDKYPECGKNVASSFSAYLSFKIAMVKADGAMDSLFGSSTPKSSSTSKGLCTNMLLDYYDSRL